MMDLSSSYGRLGNGQASGSGQFGVAQVLVDRLPAGPVVTGTEGFGNTGADSSAARSGVRGKGRLLQGKRPE